MVDPRSATPAEIRDRCAALAQEHEGRADERLVADLMEAAGARGRGVLGLDRVLDAANQHAIDLLLLDAGETVPGAVCPECGRLARSDGACPSCGAATRRVADLFDAAAEAVRAAGGAVRYVLAPTPLAGFEAGALVRFPVAGRRGVSGASRRGAARLPPRPTSRERLDQTALLVHFSYEAGKPRVIGLVPGAERRGGTVVGARTLYRGRVPTAR